MGLALAIGTVVDVLPLTKQQVIKIAAETVVSSLVASIGEANVSEGWPQSAYKSSPDPVWKVMIPAAVNGVGGSHYIVISQLTGKILANGIYGE